MARRLPILSLALLLFSSRLPAQAPAPPKPSLPGGVFRVHSAQDGLAFVIQTRSRTLFLLTTSSALGDDGLAPGGPPCTLDTGDHARTLPCKVAYTYPSVGLVVLRADATDFPGAFPPLTLGDSADVDSSTPLSTVSYTESGAVQTTPLTFVRRVPPFDLQLNAAHAQPGSPVMTSSAVIAIVTAKSTDGHVIALRAEVARLALSNEEPFRGLWRTGP